MLEKIANNIVEKQIEKQLLSEEEREIYIFGYQVLLNQIINTFSLILIAALFSAWLPVTVFSFFYIPLRSYCGGYHSRTNWGCGILSAAITMGFCISVKALGQYDTWMLQIILVIFTGVSVYCFAPVEDENKPLDENEEHRYRKIGRFIWLGEFFFWGICFWWNRDVSLMIAISHFILAVILIAGKLKNTFFLQSNM